MARLNLKLLRSSLVLPLAFFACLLRAEEGDSANKKTRAQRISDAEIVWDSLGFHGGPRIVGENAVAVYRGNLSQTSDLMKKLDDENAFIAAHVLLTELWRVPQRQKNTFSHALSDGFFVCHNGLHVQLKWEDDLGKEKKTVEIFDLDCQKKRLREFWKTRLREHPAEFSDETKVEDK
jgi:hypothetical protein